MSGGGKGGSQTTSVEIPEWLESAAQQNMARADQVAQTGYVPYMGPDVAAMTPMQQAAMQNTSGAANAFGMNAAADPMAGMPQAQTFSNGVLGYSSAPLYQESLGALQEAAPAQYDHITGMFIDPVTGAPARDPFGQPAAAQPAPAQYGGSSSGSSDGPSYTPRMGGNAAGYTGFRDMIDGGGPGTSGDTFQGGGLISNVANKVATPRSSKGGGSMGGGK